MSYHVNYQLVKQPESRFRSFDFKPDRMSVVTALNRIASVAQERILLMLNNTGMCAIRRLANIREALMYLEGKFDDPKLPGDTGEFYRRKLADQLHVTFAVEGVTHTNILSVVEAAIILERETRRALADSAKSRFVAPSVEIDETILEILARIADVF
ncbi:uncharacterized protein LOC127842911 [Dreissena polymorpha]|uniref:Uncharacterized protein n=1 Tax=Dreissena polymorpha TaxID=45954 RepID=A0A9D4EHT4_DREPO|nr:uncharacterized protein LOC127842911 [Dreissena polymorpha]KAH3779489.1 hypothetical protein DPMN_157292 [Dreissena polymorpha]